MTIISWASSAPLKVMHKQSGRHESSYFIAAASSAVSSHALQCYHQDFPPRYSLFVVLVSVAEYLFTVLGCYIDGHTQRTEGREA